MLNHIKKSACTLTAVLATAALPALAASSIDVKVVGTITPTACVPTLSGGGTIDYGSINPNTLATDAYTLLEEKKTTFSIVCDAPAKVAVQFINQRVGSLAGSTNETSYGGALPSGVEIFGFGGYGAGLGLDGTAKIGGYGLRLVPDTFTVNGSSTVTSIVRTSPTADFAATSLGVAFGGHQPRQLSWASKGTSLPVAFTTLSGQLGVQAFINKASELDLTKPITLDGLSTLELVYL